MDTTQHSWLWTLALRPSVHAMFAAAFVVLKEILWCDYHQNVEFRFSSPGLRDFDTLLNEGGWIHLLVMAQALLLFGAAVAYELVRRLQSGPSVWYRIPMAVLFGCVVLAFGEHLAELYSVGSEKQALSSTVLWFEGRFTAISSGFSALWLLGLATYCLYKTPSE